MVGEKRLKISLEISLVLGPTELKITGEII